MIDAGTESSSKPEREGSLETEVKTDGSAAKPRHLFSRRNLLQGVAAVGVLTAVGLYRERGIPELAAPLPAMSLTEQPAPVGARIVHFWATWCGVCSAMHANLDGLDNLMLVATSSGSEAEVRAWLEEEGRPLDNVYVDTANLSRAWGITVFPTTVFVNADNEVLTSTTGYTSTLGLRVRSWL